MIIYFALLIPFITKFILWKYYSHQTLWWEFCIPFVVSLGLIIGAKAIIEKVALSCPEYYGSFVQQVEYYEDWNEYIHRTCTRSCGKNCITTYDCSYVQYHPAEYKVRTNTGEVIDVSLTEYLRLKDFFGNSTFRELNRNSYTNDGDEYFSAWGRDSVHAIPVTTIHSYENHVKACDQSIFHFAEVDDSTKKKYALLEYPEIKGYYRTKAILGDDSPQALYADQQLNYINGELGPKKEVRMFICIYKNQPIEAALYQEAYWSGANMNEFVVCIGVDNARQVKWCKVLSWTRSEHLKAATQQFVRDQDDLNLNAIVWFLRKNVKSEWTRRNFHEFDYLTVEPPTWAIVLTYLITILVNIGLSCWIIRNDYDNTPPYVYKSHW